MSKWVLIIEIVDIIIIIIIIKSNLIDIIFYVCIVSMYVFIKYIVWIKL